MLPFGPVGTESLIGKIRNAAICKILQNHKEREENKNGSGFKRKLTFKILIITNHEYYVSVLSE